MSEAASIRPDWRRWLVVAALLFAIAFALLHLVGAARQAMRVANDRHDAVEPWMTVGQVARMYDVRPEALEEAIGLEPGSSGRRPLGVIARRRGETFESMQVRVFDAVERLRSDAGASPGGGR